MYSHIISVQLLGNDFYKNILENKRNNNIRQIEKERLINRLTFKCTYITS